MVLVGLVWSDFKSRGACTTTFPKEIYHLSYAKHISHPEDISFALGQSPSQSPALTALPKGEPRGRWFEQGLAVFQSLPHRGRWLAQRDGGSLPTNRAADAPIFLSQKRKLPAQIKGRGALHSTRCHPNSVFFIKTALFLSVTWTNPSLSAMTPFGRHSRSHPSQLRSQPARNERTKPLFASGNNPLRRSTSFLSFFRRFSLCFAQPEAVHQIYQCLALQVCTNAAGATSLTVRGYTQTNSIKTIIWDLQYFSNPDHRAPVHGSVPRR